MTRYCQSYTSRAVYPGYRRDAHSLRCEFRRLVNGGHAFASEYENFARVVDVCGLEAAVSLYKLMTQQYEYLFICKKNENKLDLAGTN